jgi:hypothetical protein
MYKKTAGRDSIWALPSLLIRRPTISSPRLHRGEVLSRCSLTKSQLVQYCTSVISNDRPTVVFVTRLVVSQLGASPRHFHSAAVVLCSSWLHEYKNIGTCRCVLHFSAQILSVLWHEETSLHEPWDVMFFTKRRSGKIFLPADNYQGLYKPTYTKQVVK